MKVKDGFQCECTENFLGNRCEAVIRHCILDNPCENGAVCEDLPQGQSGQSSRSAQHRNCFSSISGINLLSCQFYFVLCQGPHRHNTAFYRIFVIDVSTGIRHVFQEEKQVCMTIIETIIVIHTCLIVSIIVIHTCLLLNNLYYSHTYLFTPEKRAVSLCMCLRRFFKVSYNAYPRDQSSFLSTVGHTLAFYLLESFNFADIWESLDSGNKRKRCNYLIVI